MDWIANGQVADFKSTSTYTYTHNTKIEDYIKQLSIYRWLAPELITNEVGQIHFIFTDWKSYFIKQQENYPPARTHTLDIPLMSLKSTEAYLKSRLKKFDINKDKDEEDLPRCTDEELWRTPITYKYYANPAKLSRATKNFPNKPAAYSFKASKGNVGVIKEVGGEVRACRYCSARLGCSQKDEYLADGSLTLI